jgi:hypothetical protein
VDGDDLHILRSVHFSESYGFIDNGGETGKSELLLYAYTS